VIRAAQETDMWLKPSKAIGTGCFTTSETRIIPQSALDGGYGGTGFSVCPAMF
jgi:hypothetical protein